MVDSKIKVLLVEDDADDYIITRDLLREAEAAQFSLEWVRTYEAALEAISRQEHDVYLLDYRLGAYTGLDLLQAAIQSGCNAPIILLTGQGDREVDVAAMQVGAADYLVKSQLSAPLMERSIRHALERKQNQEVLRESEERLRFMTETSSGALYERKYDATTFDYMSPVITKLTGYSPQEINAIGIRNIIVKVEGDITSTQVDLAARKRAKAQGEFQADYQVRTKAGELRWLSDHSVAWRDAQQNLVGWVGILSDITARKEAEERQRSMTHGL
ncbi:MAG: PAS domain S-box protein, partial [Abitibacteriaceae bacterium]|nr:PAS domain S-box protein [Abditibacteriaceae bacterium]